MVYRRWIGLAPLLACLALSACGASPTAQVRPTATTGPSVALAATIHLAAPSSGSHPIASGLWFAVPGLQTFYEIDPASDTVVASAPFPSDGGDYYVGAGSLWIGRPGAIERLNPSTGQVLATIPLAGMRADGARMASDATSLWVGETYNNLVARIDLKTNQVITTIPIDALPTSVVVADGSVWVCAHHSFHAQPALWRIDPTTYQTVAKIDTTEGLGYQCGAVLADANGMIWVLNVQEIQNAHDLLRIDPTTNSITAKAVIDDELSDFVMDPTSVWVMDASRGAVARYDAHSGQLVGLSAPLTVGGPTNQEVPGLIIEADGALWAQSFTSPNQGSPGPTVWHLSISG